MERRRIPRTVRQQVRTRARDRCEYCRHPASYSSAPFVCDHVLPRVRGAGNTLSELAWSCPGCHSHKYDKIRAPDPQTGRTISLFNPRRQSWVRHFAWSDDLMRIIGRTATGRATVEALRLNRPELINLRQALLFGPVSHQARHGQSPHGHRPGKRGCLPPQNELDRDPHSPDNRLTAKNVRIDGDSTQQILMVHGFYLV